MSTRKFRKMTTKKLYEELQKAQEELASTLFDVRVGREKDYAQVSWLKKDIARMHSVLADKDLVDKTSTKDNTQQKNPEVKKKSATKVKK